MTITIPAFHESDTEWMINKLESMGVDVTKCYICGKEIIKVERPPRVLWERWRAWRKGIKFYDWNIAGVTAKGIVCDRLGCFAEALYMDR